MGLKEGYDTVVKSINAVLLNRGSCIPLMYNISGFLTEMYTHWLKGPMGSFVAVLDTLIVRLTHTYPTLSPSHW